MAQLTLSSIPGFVDLPDSALQADQPLTDYTLTKISGNAKFATVRRETFYGWYANGETVNLPVSPMDGYAYSRGELEYDVAAWGSRSASGDGATNGALVKPARASVNDGPGSLFLMDYWVEEKNEANPGKVHCETHYWGDGNETVTYGGVVKVRTLATRLSG
jgi:hypothetical protein